ncbi:MAG: redoxin domain-containing protein, partial [Proteobacteria bacterium]|nr:redoxin domain-containing protein [Pseudomonadota bacterium]
MRDSAEELKKYNVKLYVISCDDLEKTKKFAEELGNKFP